MGLLMACGYTCLHQPVSQHNKSLTKFSSMIHLKCEVAFRLTTAALVGHDQIDVVDAEVCVEFRELIINVETLTQQHEVPSLEIDQLVIELCCLPCMASSAMSMESFAILSRE